MWATALTVLLGLLFAGITALTLAMWATDPTYTQTNPVVDLGFFTLGGILVTVGFASQIRARQVAGLQQAILALLALAVAGLLVGRIEPFLGALLLLVAAAPLVVLHPVRRRLLAQGQGSADPWRRWASQRPSRRSPPRAFASTAPGCQTPADGHLGPVRRCLPRAMLVG